VTGYGWERVAEERGQGESVTALRNRVHKFKKKYAPLLRRHEERSRGMLLWLKAGAAAAVAGAVAVLLWWLLAHRERPREEPPITPPAQPAPSATASTSPEPFNQALPPSPSSPPAGTEKPGGGR